MAVEIEQQTLFEELVKETHQLLYQKDRLEEQYIDIVVRIGQNLNNMRPHKPYGAFEPWVATEFKITPRTANNYMHIATVYGNNQKRVSDLPLRVVGLLAAPSTPDKIRMQVEVGEIPPVVDAIREATREYQQQTSIPVHVSTPAIPFTEEPDDEDSWDDGIPSIQPEAQPAPVYAPVEEPVMPTKSPTLMVLQSSESNEWFTPAQYVDATRELMGGIDIDPASNKLANEIIQAATYYDIDTNGLDKPWSGRVWLNPPYGRDNGGSNQEVWSHRLIEQFQSGITKEAVLLVNANTEAKWFQPFYDYSICFTNHRIKFYTNDGTPSQPTQGNALIYLGTQQERFIEVFKQFGRILKAVD